MLAATTIAAQDYTVRHGYIGRRDHQMTVAYGFLAVQGNDEPRNLDDSTRSTLGPLWMSYLFALDSSVSLGMEVGYHELRGRVHASDSLATISDVYLRRTAHLAAQASLTWYRTRWVSVSSTASLGVAVILRDENDDSSPVIPAYHVGLASIRVAGDASFRLELGYGYRGALNIGMSFVM